DIGFRDYYKIDLDVSGQIVIDILNHPLANVTGAQIQLFFGTNNTPVAFDVLPPYHIAYNGEPGIYYLYLYNDVSKCTLQGINCDIPYALTVNFPAP
ncbi:MAG TPA: hypothetical protein PK530_19580, partial [Anaerolineales bacterium]|nr:hypothetical protein [Anaerolineales bacterium]